MPSMVNLSYVFHAFYIIQRSSISVGSLFNRARQKMLRKTLLRLWPYSSKTLTSSKGALSTLPGNLTVLAFPPYRSSDASLRLLFEGAVPTTVCLGALRSKYSFSTRHDACKPYVCDDRYAIAFVYEGVVVLFTLSGNGMTHPFEEVLSYYDMACTSASAHPVLDISYVGLPSFRLEG